MKKSTLDCKYLFIAPPSIGDLESRLRGRGTEKEDKIVVRLQNAKGELEYGNTEGNFDAVITNDDLEACYNKIVDTIASWFPEADLKSE